MTSQELFDKTIDLLRNKRHDFSFSSKLVDNYETNELTFHCFDELSIGTTKSHLLKVYEARTNFENERKDNPHVFGYDTLLPNFRQTHLEYICISTFTTNIGSFIIFSDFDRQDLIGVLFSKTTLSQIRERMNEHKRLVELTGEKVFYDYAENENVFINGQLQSQGNS